MARFISHAEVYLMGKRNSTLTVCTIIIFTLSTLSIVNLVPNAEADPPWENVLTISKTIEIPPGQEYYAYFDEVSGTIIEKALPSKEAGLTQKAIDALDQVPNWLYEDLAKKFAELGETTIDSGDFAAPAFADMDADLDLDITLGSEAGTLYYFENVGTKSRPIFVRNDELYSRVNTHYLQDVNRTSPTIADLDDDGDNDLLVGYHEGDLHKFINSGSSMDPEFGYINGHIGLQESANYPSLVDLDDDGDFDLAAGTTDGYINFFEYTDGEPPIWEYSYRIYTGEDDDRPVCLADMDDDGDYDLSVGDGDLATLYYYRNIGTTSQEIWAEDLTFYSGVTPEYGTSPAIADLNGDLRSDLFVGGQSGSVFSYRNTGTASDAQWLIWSFYQVGEGYMYYPKDVLLTYRADYHQDRYADLIQNANQKYKDEIAFSIAHMPYENLKAMNNNQTQLFIDNAQLIYEIDQHLDYVEVIEKSDYTTTRYRFGEPGNVVERELPRDIYYWFIVHPKITDENVYYIHPDDADSNHPTDPSDGGRFWREYLFYHADSAYPLDDSGAPDDGIDDYPNPEVSPPLLKDLLDGVDILFNGTTWFAPGGNYTNFKNTGEDDRRPFDYGYHAIIRVSNWVGKTLILNQQEVSDTERPIQPVRVAHHHNGNCGELQDLTTAAARTALIPATGILLLGEDHVWIEFYDNGWHQWDNYWSDGGSVIDMFDNYWVGWGQRGGSGITKHMGDDDAFEATDHYIPKEDLNYVTIRVVDNNGDPVDGARVLVISYWLSVDIEGYQVEIPFPCIWNYTDSNGETLFKLATQEIPGGNQNFTFKIISKVGSTESGKMELEHGQDYTFTFPLEGSTPCPELDTNAQSDPNPADPNYRFGIDYQVISATQHPRNLLTGNYHPKEIPSARLPDSPASDFAGNHIDSFITSEDEFIEFLKGYNFDSYRYYENHNLQSYDFDLPDDTSWYFVLSNRDSIETTKVVEIIINLDFKPPSYSVKITNPPDSSQLSFGDIVTITGIITNESELQSLRLTTDFGITWVYPNLAGNQWIYDWNTASLNVGTYTIEAQADYGSSQSSDSVEVELVDNEPPEIGIQSPSEDAQIEIGQMVTISGFAQDNIAISDLQLSMDGGTTWIDILSTLFTDQWSHSWATKGLDPGGYVIVLSASDDSYSVFDSIYVELVDTQGPQVSIQNPMNGEEFNIGSIVTITGEASDNRGITSLQLSTDSGQSFMDILSSLNGTAWSYEWNTQGLPLGERTLVVNASDSIFNTSFSIDCELVDSQEPEISISYPAEDSLFDTGSLITISGDATDNVGIVDLQLSTDGGITWVDIYGSLENGHWSYDWDTSLFSPGMCTIQINASDNYFEVKEFLHLELVDSVSPTLSIESPSQNEKFSPGETIYITGYTFDNCEILELKIGFDSGDTWVDLLSSLEDGDWFYDWDTEDVLPGDYTITVYVSDGVNDPIYSFVEIEIVDTEIPVLQITAPSGENLFETGSIIEIKGTASDNLEIQGLWFSDDYGKSWKDILTNLDNRGRWSYQWDTTGYDTGSYSILFKVSDGTNEVQDSMTIVLFEREIEGDDEEVSQLFILMIMIILTVITVSVILGAVYFQRYRKK
jgi:hypothetical protein